MSTDLELFGSDIALDSSFEPRIAANGELLLAHGVDTANQDIMLRLYTPLGELFYDKGFGSLIHLFVQEDSTPEVRAALCAEVARRIGMDPAVIVGSVSCAVLSWSEKLVTLQAAYQLIAEDHPRNLVLRLGTEAGDMTAEVLSDVDPR